MAPKKGWRQRLQPLVELYFGDDAKLLDVRHAPLLAGRLFVVDTLQGGEIVRVLASWGDNDRVTQQSAMSVARPDRLIFHYERMMAMSFAFHRGPRSALLFGLGGGAMLRYLASAYPECATTVVELDKVVAQIAKRWFGVSQAPVLADAAAFLAKTEGRWDVIHVDTYDAEGFRAHPKAFWRDCARALAPGGIVAINWADFHGNERARAFSDAARAQFRHALFMTPRGFSDNLVQFSANRRLPSPEQLGGAITGHARLQRPRSTLSRCVVTRRWPA